MGSSPGHLRPHLGTRDCGCCGLCIALQRKNLKNSFYLFFSKREREKGKGRETFVVPLITASLVASCMHSDPGSNLQPCILIHQDDTPTNCTAWPGLEEKLLKSPSKHRPVQRVAAVGMLFRNPAQGRLVISWTWSAQNTNRKFLGKAKAPHISCGLVPASPSSYTTFHVLRGLSSHRTDRVLDDISQESVFTRAQSTRACASKTWASHPFPEPPGQQRCRRFL